MGQKRPSILFITTDEQRFDYPVCHPKLFPRGAVWEDRVEAIDLPVTFRDVTGVGAPLAMQGRSLVGLADGKIGDRRGYAFSAIGLYTWALSCGSPASRADSRRDLYIE